MWALDDRPLRFAALAHIEVAAVPQQSRLDLVYDLESWLAVQVGPRFFTWTWATEQGIQSAQWTLTFQREQDSCLFTLRWGGT